MIKTKKLLLALFFILITLVSLCFAACGDIEFKIRFYESYNAGTGKYNKLIEIIELGEEGDFELPDPPTRSGYAFDGWCYILNNAETAFDAEMEISGNLSVYAKWRQLPAAPSNFKFNKDTDPTCLTWTAVSGAAGYEIALTEAQKDSESGLIVIADPSVLTYEVTAYGEYAAYIRTVASNGDKSAWSKTAEFSIVPLPAKITFIDGTATHSVKDIVNGKVTLPSDPLNPADDSRRFLGWYLESGGATEFDPDNAGNSSTSVYAKWEEKPTAPSGAVDIRYESAKASGNQRIIITDSVNSNVKSYTLIITDADGEPIGEPITQTGKNFILASGLGLEEEEFYTVTIIVTSNNQWYESLSATEKTFMTALCEEYSFEYQVLDPSTYYVYFMYGETLLRLVPVTEGYKVPTPEPKDLNLPVGYVLEKWLTEAEGVTEFDFNALITKNTTVYAKLKSLPAPTGLAYDLAAKGIKWNTSTNAVSYQLAFEEEGKEAPVTVSVGTFYSFYTPGAVAVYVRSVDSEGRVSAWSAARTITVSQTQVKFMVDGIERHAMNINHDTLELDSLPLSPVNTLDKRFLGWYLDQAGTTAFVNENLTSNITVYAKWDVMPTAPTPATFTYYKAKAAGSQLIVLSESNSNVNGYIVIIKNSLGVTVESFTHTAAQGKTFELNKTLYTTGETYTVEITVESNNLWYADLEAEVKTTMTAMSSSNFTYAVTPQDIYTVTLRDSITNNIIDQFTVDEGDLIDDESLEVVRIEGYRFKDWVTTQGGSVSFDFDTLPTGNVTIYASYISFSAPSGLTYNKDTKKIVWSEIEGCTYELALTYAQRETPISVDVNYYDYITAGSYTAYVRAVDKEGNRTAWRTASFSITQFTVTFRTDGNIYQSVLIDLATDTVTLPDNPSNTASRRFMGWYLDQAGTTPFVNENLTSNKTVYAKWDVMPTAPTPATFTYYKAKAAGSQLIVLSESNSNVNGYIVIIKNSLGVEVERFTHTAAQGKTFELTKAFYTEDQIYTVEVTVVSNNTWYIDLEAEDKTTMTAVSSSNFTYAVTPQDIYTVTLRNSITNNIIRQFTVDEGDLILIEGDTLEAVRVEGQRFDGWVTTQGGSVSFDFTVAPTGNVTIYASYISFSAPSGLTYNTAAKQLEWSTVEGCTYELALTPADRDDPTKHIPLSSANYGLIKVGPHTVYVRAVDGDGNKSVWNSVTFSVNQIYVTFMDGATTNAVAINLADDCIDIDKLPTNPANTQNKRFLGWYYDLEDSDSEFANENLTSNITVYAKWDVMPTAPTPATFTYYKAKAAGSQLIVLSESNSNVNGYIVIIKNSLGVEVESFYHTAAQGKTFELTKAFYTKDQIYTVELTVVSNNIWYIDLDAEDKTPMTAMSSSNFTYGILDNDSYTVTFMDGNDVYATKSIIEGNAVTPPDIPFKDGYKFNDWVTTQGGSVSFNFDIVPTDDTTIYIKWDTFSAPMGFKYTAATRLIEWEGAAGCKYELSIDGEIIQVEEGLTSYYYYTVGTVPTYVRAVDNEGNKSAWSAMRIITVSQTQVKFMVDGVERHAMNINHDTLELNSLPASPSNTLDKRFLGWYLDQAGTTPFVNENLTSNITVYAKWDVMPTAPTPATFTYYKAKAAGSQLIVLSESNSNVNGYIVIIKNSLGVTVESFTHTAAQGKTFELDKTLYTVGETYTVEITVKSNNLWYANIDAEDKTTMTAVSSSSFIYAVTPQDIYTVTLRDGTTGAIIGEPFTVTEGNAVTKPDIPFKEGYRFIDWVTTQGGSVSFDFDTLPTGNVTIYASYISFSAPSNLTYNTTTKQLEWSTVEGCTYELALTYADREDPSAVTKNFMYYIIAGSYNASVRAVDENGNRTAWSAVYNFSITQVYVTFMNEGTQHGSPILVNLADDCIDIDDLPANPSNTSSKRFMGWYYDLEDSDSEFANENLTSNITVYAKWDVMPTAPTPATFTYYKAKAAGSQLIVLSESNSNVNGYIVIIKNSLGVEVESFYHTAAQGKTFELTKAFYTKDQIYTVELTVVSNNIWYIDLDAEDKTPMTAMSSSNFTYAVTPQDIYTVTLRSSITNNIIEQFTVTEGDLIDYDSLEVVRIEGQRFDDWVTTQGGSVSFDFTVAPTGSVTIYASYASFSAPAGLTYNTTTKQLEWNTVEGCAYELALTYADREDPLAVTENFKYYIAAGSYTAYVRAVDAESNKSAWSAVYNFSITQVYVTFMRDGVQHARLQVDLATDKLNALPTPPDSSAARYFLGWVDGEDNAFVNENITQDLILYADWEYPPTVTAPSLIYRSARLTGTQKLTWSDITEGVEKYIIEIWLGTTRMSENEVSSSSVKEFTLSGSYTAGTAYTAKIKTVMTAKWHGYTVESAWQTITFTYAVLPNAQITFMVGDEVHAYRTTANDGTVSFMPLVPVKEGFVFSKWVFANGDTYTGQQVLDNTTVYASWTARPLAPQSVNNYDDSTLTLSWSAIDGVTEYQYKIDNDQTVRTVAGTSLQLFGLAKGTHTVYFKITKGGIDSEWSEVTFTVNAVYIMVNGNNGTVNYVAVVDGKIAAPATPIWSGYQFQWWSLNSLAVLYENNPGSGINFSTATFNTTTQIYAQWYVKPAEITGAQWSEGSGESPDTLTITDDANASYYWYKWSEGGTKTKLEAKTLDLSSFYLPEGEATIYIQSVRYLNGVEVVSSFKQVTFTVLYTTDLIRDENGLIREKSADGVTTTYVFYAGFTYEFPNTVFETNGARYAFPDSGNSGKIRFTDVLGEFELKFEYGGAAKTWKAKVVSYVNFIQYNNSYASYFSASAIEGNSIFVGKGNPYEVGIGTGSGNYFIDLSTNTSGYTFNQSQLYLNMKFQYEDSNGIRTDAPYFSAEHDSATDRYILKYTGDVSGAIGKTLVITLSPKYLNYAQYAQVSNYTVEFRLKLNNGVNVYTHAQLKAAFGNTSITKINLHSDITAEFAADQVNSDGTAVNYLVGSVSSEIKADGNYIYSVKTYDLAKYLNSSLLQNATQAECLSIINSATSADRKSAIAAIGRRVIAANVYYRFLTDQNDNLVVNGNYFTIDSGSGEHELRKVSNTAEGWTQVWYGQEACNMAVLDKVQSVHTAMFLVQNLSQGTTVNVTYNNLEIDGNTKLIGNDSSSITLYSGGMNGFMAVRSTINCNNTVAREFTIGYFFDSSSNVINNYNYITDSLADANWANGIYSHGTAAITLKNSRFLRCSGAAVHIEDADSGRNTYDSIIYNNADTGAKIPLYDNSTDRTAEVRRDPALIIYTDTKIENWITGEEAWFTAWGVSAMIPGLKSGLQSNAQTLLGQSVIKEIDGVEKVNFALMMRPVRDESQMEVCIKDKEGVNPDIEYTLVSNTDPGENAAHTLPYNDDPRHIDTTGQLLTPVGKTADTLWAARVGAYATYRVYLNYIATSYGLTMEVADANVRSNPSAHPEAHVQYLALETAYAGKLDAALEAQIAALCQSLSYDASQITASMPAILYHESVNMSSGVAAVGALSSLGIEGGTAVNIGGSQFFQLAMSGADIGAGTASGPQSLAYIWISYGSGGDWWNSGS